MGAADNKDVVSLVLQYQLWMSRLAAHQVSHLVPWWASAFPHQKLSACERRKTVKRRR